MCLRSINRTVGWFLLVFMTMGLTISTLHSHHELRWHKQHTENYADTGNKIFPDISHCPICGYIFKTALSAHDSATTVYFSSREVIHPGDIIPTDVSEVVIKGRSPPKKV